MNQSNFRKEKRRHQKFRTHNLILKIASLLMLVGIFIVISPNLTGKKVDTEVNNQIVTGNSAIHQVAQKFNPVSKQLLVEYWIGDKSELSSLKDDKDLSNIKYATRALLASSNERLSTKAYKINDHFIVIEIKNVNAKFGWIEVDILPLLINKKINMNSFENKNLNRFFVSDKKVTLLQGKIFKNSMTYKTDYDSYMINCYQRIIDKQETIIDKLVATNKKNTQLITNLKEKRNGVSRTEKVDIDQQIQEYQNDITSNRSDQQKAAAKIKTTKEAINAIKNGTAVQ